MRMARSIWSGTILFGMIAIPVKMFTAVRHKGVSFNQLDDRNMGRIRYQKVSEQTGEEVPSDQIVKRYEITRGHYIKIDPDELEPFVPAATKTIDLEEFVDLDQIDPIYFEKPYYLAPAPEREALRAARPSVGVGGQGGDWPLCDAQPAVHGGDPGREQPALCVTCPRGSRTRSLDTRRIGRRSCTHAPNGQPTTTRSEDRLTVRERRAQGTARIRERLRSGGGAIERLERHLQPARFNGPRTSHVL